MRKGDVLAKIDPAPFQAALDQAVAKKSQDEAQLIDAQKDLARFKTLVVRNAETQQNVDAQQAKVDQFKAMIDADQAAIEAAQTQLNYTTIAAPIDGVVGFRQVDIGNIIHTTDANPLTVLTQIKPCVAIFTLPQDDLGPVREAMVRGSVEVLAFDQDDVSAARAGPAAPDRQSDRPEHQHDPAEGGVPEPGRAPLAGRVRAHPHSHHHPQRRRDDPAGRRAARPRRPLCVGHQTRQYRGAAPDRRADRQR